MLYTSNYKNIKSLKYHPVSISFDRGKDAGFFGEYNDILAPKLSFWRVWKQNRNILSDMVNNRFYIEEYYNQILYFLDSGDIYNSLNNSILLYYEDNIL